MVRNCKFVTTHEVSSKRYDIECGCGHRFDAHVPLSALADRWRITCPKCKCRERLNRLPREKATP